MIINCFRVWTTIMLHVKQLYVASDVWPETKLLAMVSKLVYFFILIKIIIQQGWVEYGLLKQAILINSLLIIFHWEKAMI